MKLFCVALFTFLFTTQSFSQTLDGSFAPFFTGPSQVTASALQSDNKLILAGDFIAVGTTRVSGGIIRLNTDGTVDNTFSVGLGLNGTAVRALTVQVDGKILVGGSFTQFNGTASGNVIRLNANGSIDNTFTAGTAANSVAAFAVQSDNKIVVAGAFTAFNGDASLKGIVRLNTNGTIDNTFTPPDVEFTSFNSGTRMALVIQPSDGKILMGSYHGTVDGAAKPYLLRLNTNGTVDTGFMTNIGTGPNNVVSSIDFQSDGKIIIAGRFTRFNSVSDNRNRIARLNADGTLEGTFAADAGFNSGNLIQSAKVITSDKILVTGGFTSPKSRILRLNSSGTVDNTFNPGTGFAANDGGSSEVLYAFVQSDNKIVVTGNFQKYNGTNRLNVARLSDVGVLESAYAPNPAGVATIYKSEVLSTGKILICGDFLYINGSPYSGIARLLSTGAPDNTFAVSGISIQFGAIRTFGIQPSNGKVLIGGDIVYSSSRGLARLSPDGVFDNTFSGFTTVDQTVSTDGVYAIVPTADDKFIVGGSFTSINGVAKSNFVKLNTNGSLDNTFNVAGTEFVNRIINIETRASDGKMILTEHSRNSDHQPDALISLANPDGSRVNTFDVSSKINGSYLHDAIFLPDGKILIGGDFSTYDGVSVARFLRVDDSGVRDITFKNPVNYASYKVSDLYYSSSLNKLVIGKDQFSVFSPPTDANYFDVMDVDGNIIADDLAVTGGINSIIPIGSSFLLSGKITKIGSTDMGSIAKINIPPAPVGAPTSLGASATNQPRKVVLTWTDNCIDEGAFEIQRSKTNNTSFQTLTQVAPNIVTYTDQENLDAATTYYYRVRATNTGGNTAFSNEVNITTAPASPPISPSGLTAGVATAAELWLTWNDNSTDETGFEIFRSTVSNAGFTKIFTTAANTKTYISSGAGIVAGTTYYFKVRAIKIDDASAFTNEANATTLPSPPVSSWSGALAPLVPARSNGVAIVLNGKAYVGLGRNAGGTLKDWWEYDPTNNTWIQKLDFPGTARIGAVAFVVNGKGYVGTGNDFSGNGFKRDFYEYDANNNTWTPKADFPEDFASAAGITSGAAFAIGNYGYVGLGNTGVNNPQAFFRYDPGANSWTARANFGGAGRIGAVGFDANGKGYFGFGYGGLSVNRKDMWEYDPTADTWTAKADFSGSGRGGATAAVVNGFAYLFAGSEGDFSSSVSTNLTSQYSPSTNEWSTQPVIPLSIRNSAMAFAIGSKAYVYGGVNSTTYYSDLVAFTPSAGLAPLAPGSPLATYISDTSLKLSWTDNSSDETKFVVEFATFPDFIYYPINSPPAGSTQYTINGLTVGTQYRFRVKAINVYGYSAYATSATFTLLAPPSNLTVQSFTTSQVVFNWTDNSSNETGFEIYRSATVNTGYTLIHTTLANTTTYTNTGLNAGTMYYYKIRAVNTVGSSSYSNEISQTTPTLPAAPTNLTVQSFSSNKITITWTDNATNETGFEIYRKTSSIPFALIKTTGPNVTTLADESLTAATTYTYQLRAVNANGVSAYTTEVSQVTLPNPPTAPSNLTTRKTTADKLELTWTDNSSNETGFEVFRSKTDNTAYSLLTTTTANTSIFTDLDVELSTKYFYKVRALNTGGNSAFSSEATAIITITGIGEEVSSEVVFYPNPAKEILYIKNPTAKILKVSVVNVLGQNMLSIEVGAKCEVQVPCAGWSAGVYVLQTSSARKNIRISKE